MRDTITRLKAHIGDVNASTVLVCVVLLTTVAIGVAVAQESAEEQTYTDDFEDGDASDWVNEETGIEAQTSSVSAMGGTSLHVFTEQFDGTNPSTASFDWTNGPELDTSEEFHVSGLFRPERDADSGPIRIGIGGPNQAADGENAFIVFRPDETYLATATQQSPNGGALQPFEDTWVRFRMESSSSSAELRAKVWEYGTPEPASWHLSRSDFDDVQPGYFGVNPGYNTGSGSRDVYLDKVIIRGTPVTPPTSERLSIDAPVLLQHGQTDGYDVRYVGDNNRTQTVTDDAAVSSLNISAITVDESANTLTATSDENVSGRFEIQAEYEGESQTAEVVVAKPTVENLDILPTLWRFNALLSDGTVFALIIATFFAVIATWLSTPFAGIGAMELAVLIGWFGGWIPLGIMLVSVFAALFIGFNVAANIDYAVT
jgi:hypothetical protein